LVAGLDLDLIAQHRDRAQRIHLAVSVDRSLAHQRA